VTVVPSRVSERVAEVFHRADVGGLLLVACLAGWILLSAAMATGARVGPIGTLTTAATGYVVARLLPRRWNRAIAAAVVLIVVALGAWSWRDLLDGDPIGGPLGYQNANAALFLQAFVASLVLVALSASWWRAVAATVAALLAGSLVIIGSMAAVALAAAVGIVGVVALVGHRRIASTTVLAAGFLACLVATVVLGATYTPRSGDGAIPSVASSSNEMRLALWHDALSLMVEHPIIGIGPGRFAEESQVAASDPDTRQGHQEFLQVGAESGVVGGLLLAAVCVWAIARAGPDQGPVGVIVAAGVAALGIHACVDYVLHFPLVPVTSAILAGAASSHHPKNGSTSKESGDVTPPATNEEGSDA
jgi:O-antigen ligase